jgi:hypothetical protein
MKLGSLPLVLTNFKPSLIFVRKTRVYLSQVVPLKCRLRDLDQGGSAFRKFAKLPVYWGRIHSTLFSL